MANAISTGASKNSLQLTTILRYLPKLVDNITEGPRFLSYAKSHSLIQSEELIGEEECVLIDREENNNSQWFDGAENFSLDADQGLAESYVGHYNIRTGFQISDTEQLENKGEAQLLSRLKVRMNAMERSFKTDISEAIVGTRGTTYKRPEGLRDVLGGINPESSPSTLQALQWSASARPWWAPTVKSITTLGPNNTNIKTALTELMLEGQKVMAAPKVALCDQNFYLEYCKQQGGGAALPGYGHERVLTVPADRQTAKLDVAGPPDLAFAGIPILFDGALAAPSGYTSGSNAGHCMFLDTEAWELVVDPRWNFKLYKPRPRAGGDEQWADSYALVFRMTMRCWNRRRQLMCVLDV